MCLTGGNPQVPARSHSRGDPPADTDLIEWVAAWDGKQMKDIERIYSDYCRRHGLPYERITSVVSYDDTTLFCPAGMQRFKRDFRDLGLRGYTCCNTQRCLRVGDIGDLGDGSHLGVFDMLGTFSFRDWGVRRAVDFWMEFMRELGLEPDYVTVHPDREEWREFYPGTRVELDPDCTWSDGDTGGYCTEFYVTGLEVGNIVNPGGDCIDVGFGLERLDSAVNGTPMPDRRESLLRTVGSIIDSGVRPSGSKQGYVLRRLLRQMVREGVELDHEFYRLESERRQRSIDRYHCLKDSHPGMDRNWWWETHGVDLDDIQ